MLVTKDFVFIHVPKTGGSFLIDLCMTSAPKEWEAKFDRPHERYATIPAEASHLPVLSYVRNPWDWYVSWYEWVRSLNLVRGEGIAPRVWASAFESGKADFKTVVTRACTGEQFDNKLTAHLIRELGIDHYSAINHVYLGDGVDEGRVEVGRFENLRGDFLEFLERHEIAVTPTFREALESAPPINQTPGRSDYRTYYDNGLREIVGRAARSLIRRYDYEF